MEGIFGEYMSVRLVNDGPVTIIIEKNKQWLHLTKHQKFNIINM
jgi:hypothetical protein